MPAETHRPGSIMPDSPAIVMDAETRDGPLGVIVGGRKQSPWPAALTLGVLGVAIVAFTWYVTVSSVAATGFFAAFVGCFFSWVFLSSRPGEARLESLPPVVYALIGVVTLVAVIAYAAVANPLAGLVVGLFFVVFYAWVLRSKREGGKLGVAGRLAAGWLLFIVVIAFLAPVLQNLDVIKNPYDPYGSAGLPIATEGHPFGTDKSRRDVLARLVWGARSSLIVGFGAVAVGMLIGGTLGLISGFRRGKADTALTSLFSILLAFPQLVLALSLVAFLKPPPPAPGADGQIVESTGGLTAIQILILAIGIVAIPLLAQITRATALTWSQREFVTAGRAQGARGLRLMIREVLPNVLPAMFSVALLSVGIAIIAEGGLSVLGVGVEPPQPSWGNMIAEHRSVSTDPLNALFVPMFVVFLTVMALNYLGDAVREQFDVRESAL